MLLLGVLLFFSGMGVGILSALLGIGGGVIIVPLLVIVGFPRIEAIATSLFVIFLNSIWNVYLGHRKSLIKWKEVLYLGAITGSASFICASFAKQVDPKLLNNFFILFLMVVIGSVWLKESQRQIMRDFKKTFVVIVGLLAGALSGLAGLGGGAIISPFLLSSELVPPQSVAPSTNAIVALTTIFAILPFVVGIEGKAGHFGYVHLVEGFFLLAGSLAGSLIGANLNTKVSRTARKVTFTVVAVVIIIVSIFK